MADTRECSINDLRPEASQNIKRQLGPGERVLTCIETKQGGLFSSSYEKFYYGQVLTDRQMILALVHLEESVSSLSLSEILNITESGGGDNWRVGAIASEGRGLTFTFARREQARWFSAILRKQVDEAKARTRISSRDIGDQLTKLANLRAAGALTQEEFEAAKSKLLS